MTGEITLSGLVLPVGGIKEKVVAAAAAGIERVMLPARNRRDFEEIPEDAREKLSYDLYYVKNRSLFLNVLILLQTVKVVLWPAGVR